MVDYGFFCVHFANLQVPFLSPKTLRLTVYSLNHVNSVTFKSALLAKDSKLLLQKCYGKNTFTKLRSGKAGEMVKVLSSNFRYGLKTPDFRPSFIKKTLLPLPIVEQKASVSGLLTIHLLKTDFLFFNPSKRSHAIFFIGKTLDSAADGWRLTVPT